MTRMYRKLVYFCTDCPNCDLKIDNDKVQEKCQVFAQTNAGWRVIRETPTVAYGTKVPVACPTPEWCPLEVVSS